MSCCVLGKDNLDVMEEWLVKELIKIKNTGAEARIRAQNDIPPYTYKDSGALSRQVLTQGCRC